MLHLYGIQSKHSHALIGIGLILWFLWLLLSPTQAIAQPPKIEPVPVSYIALVAHASVIEEEEPPAPLTHRELIEKYAEQYGVDASLAWRIARCESPKGDDVDPTAKNPSSTASGVFQFLKGSWKYYGTQLWGSVEGKDVFNREHNIELAMYVMAKRGAVDWTASQYCWGI